MAIETGDVSLENRSSKFAELYCMNWKDDITAHALRTLGERKRKSVKALPLIKDVMCLSNHLKMIGNCSYNELVSSDEMFKHKSSMSLCEAALTTILILILF